MIRFLKNYLKEKKELKHRMIFDQLTHKNATKQTIQQIGTNGRVIVFCAGYLSSKNVYGIKTFNLECELKDYTLISIGWDAGNPFDELLFCKPKQQIFSFKKKFDLTEEIAKEVIDIQPGQIKEITNKHHKIEALVLAGHSLGGRITALYSSKLNSFVKNLRVHVQLLAPAMMISEMEDMLKKKLYAGFCLTICYSDKDGTLKELFPLMLDPGRIKEQLIEKKLKIFDIFNILKVKARPKALGGDLTGDEIAFMKKLAPHIKFTNTSMDHLEYCKSPKCYDFAISVDWNKVL